MLVEGSYLAEHLAEENALTERGKKSVPNQVSRTLLGTNRKKRLYVWKNKYPRQESHGEKHGEKFSGQQRATAGESLLYSFIDNKFEILA